MVKRMRLIVLLAAIVFPMVSASCSHARPPRPGPDFVWVKPHVRADGVRVPGHWRHTGEPRPGKVWVPGHHSPKGNWIAGHWKVLDAPRPGAHWVPGHHGPGGRWIPGHWR
jgi:hypothetical protein